MSALQEDLWRQMWERAVDDTLEMLLGRTQASNLTYMGVREYGHLEAKQVLAVLSEKHDKPHQKHYFFNFENEQ